MGFCITGIGCVSPIGNTVSENLESLLSENSGIQKSNAYSFLGKTPFLGEVKLSSEEIKSSIGLTVNDPISRTSLLGILAVKEAFGGHEVHKEIRTGFINGSSVGGMDLTEMFYKDFRNGNTSDKEVLLQHDLGSITNTIENFIGVLDYSTTISTACSSSANSILQGAQLIEKGYLDRVIVGGTDALSLFTINGFDSLQILDHELCRPFNANRKGLNLGEGAAYLVLESEKSQSITGNKIIGRFMGGANRNDAFHQTATSEEAVGATLAMKKALESSEVNPEDIDYVNAHGTGTMNNDTTEFQGLQNVFNTVPEFSSTKSFTGHTLAACGAIEAIYSLLAIEHGFIPANLRFTENSEMTPVTKTLKDKTIKNVLSNSFGFGGNNTSIILSGK